MRIQENQKAGLIKAETPCLSSETSLSLRSFLSPVFLVCRYDELWLVWILPVLSPSRTSTAMRQTSGSAVELLMSSGTRSPFVKRSWGQKQGCIKAERSELKTAAASSYLSKRPVFECRKCPRPCLMQIYWNKTFFLTAGIMSEHCC